MLQLNLITGLLTVNDSIIYTILIVSITGIFLLSLFGEKAIAITPTDYDLIDQDNNNLLIRQMGYDAGSWTYPSSDRGQSDRNHGGIGFIVVSYAEGGSIVGSYADGYELGKENGRDDYRLGNEHNSKCPPNDSFSWCGGYKIGYEAGWVAAKTLGGK